MGYVKTDRLTLKPLQDRDKSRLVALIGEFDVAKNQVDALIGAIERIKKGARGLSAPLCKCICRQPNLCSGARETWFCWLARNLVCRDKLMFPPCYTVTSYLTNKIWLEGLGDKKGQS